MRGSSHYVFVLALFVQFSQYKALSTYSDYACKLSTFAALHQELEQYVTKKIRWYGHTWITSIHISTTLCLLVRLQLPVVLIISKQLLHHSHRRKQWPQAIKWNTNGGSLKPPIHQDSRKQALFSGTLGI